MITEYLTEGHLLAIPIHFGLHTELRVSKVFELMWKPY
ncbi:hypothetical protein GGGNBK_14220 [Sporosarcina sp. ANT_H38]